MWLMTKYPEIFCRYKQFYYSNQFEPIMLEGALNLESEKEFESVKLTATVTYNTCYNHPNGEPVCITFDLGATVSVDAIVGLPTLTAWKIILDLDENKAFSKTMQIWFPFSFLDASPGLPIDSSSFSASDFVGPNQKTPDRKGFIIQQEHVAIGITDGPRHNNPPVTTNNIW